jgi:hypothetical protein
MNNLHQVYAQNRKIKMHILLFFIRFFCIILFPKNNEYLEYFMLKWIFLSSMIDNLLKSTIFYIYKILGIDEI